MNDCKLCKINKADRTGSHYLPHFLLKRIDNVDGSSGRDKELGFIIGETDTKSYIGRAVLPEQFEESFGELSDDELKAMKNPAIEDHVFCSSCETKFSRIEGEYAKTLSIYEKEKQYSSKIPSELAMLFWASVVWRASISKKYGMILKEEEEDVLRVFLDSHLKEKIAEIDLAQIKQDENFNGIGYRLIRCPDYQYPTYLLCHPQLISPYSIIIDEFVLFFYFNVDNIGKEQIDFFGLQKFEANAPINTKSSGENILGAAECLFLECMENLTGFLAELRIKKYNWIFDEVHRKMGGKGDAMPAELKKSILAQITSNEKKLGRRYNFEDLTKTMYNEMKKYTG
jgi:hypothetical protein